MLKPFSNINSKNPLLKGVSGAAISPSTSSNISYLDEENFIKKYQEWMSH